MIQVLGSTAAVLCPVQEQQKETAKLRARVTQAAIERGTLVAEVQACDSSLNAQTVRVPCVLPRLDRFFGALGALILPRFRSHYLLSVTVIVCIATESSCRSMQNET